MIIVGGGPAGLAAALYTARMNLRTVVLDRGPLGGQLLNTELVEDYPGFESVLGSELALKMGDHARKFGVDVRDFEPVHEIVVEGNTKVVRMESGEELRAPALIMAAGGLPRYLQVPGEKEFWGRGVSYCAVCDGAFFKGQELAVIGGGDAAVEEGEFLTRYASRVYILHRRSELRAQPILVARAQANSKIEFIFDAHVTEIAGDAKVQDVLYEQHGEMKELHVGGVFIFIGFTPNSSLLKVHVDHDEAGYILTGAMRELRQLRFRGRPRAFTRERAHVELVNHLALKRHARPRHVGPFERARVDDFRRPMRPLGLKSGRRIGIAALALVEAKSVAHASPGIHDAAEVSALFCVERCHGSTVNRHVHTASRRRPHAKMRLAVRHRLAADRQPPAGRRFRNDRYAAGVGKC